MSNTKLRIDENLEVVVRRFQKVAEARLNRRVSLVNASKMLGVALQNIELEELDLSRLSPRGRPSKERFKKIMMELNFRC